MSRSPLLAAALAALCSCPTAQGEKPKAEPAPAPKAAPAPAPRPVQTDVTAQDYDAPKLPRARVVLTDAFGGPHVVEVEVAATQDTRTRGLMWRKELAPGTGMLFIFPEDAVHGFWMRNTLISLDMLYIAADGTVAGIVERAEPLTLTSRSVGRPSRYVLEVPGGWCAQAGVAAGSKVRFEGIAGIAVGP